MAAKNVTIGMPHTSSECEVQKFEHASAVDQFINMDVRQHQSMAHQAPVNDYYVYFFVIGLSCAFLYFEDRMIKSGMRKL